MNRFSFTLLVFFAFTTSAFSQQSTAKWNNWNWLLGKWHGEGKGKPGTGGGVFSFAFDLDNKIIIRKSHSEYPAEGSKPKIVHEDLMVIYQGNKGNPEKAIYFDNEGQSIQYSISYSEKNIIFNSEKVENRPYFRLTYTLIKVLSTQNLSYRKTEPISILTSRGKARKSTNSIIG